MKEQPKPDWFAKICEEIWAEYTKERDRRIKEIVKKVVAEYMKKKNLK